MLRPYESRRNAMRHASRFTFRPRVVEIIDRVDTVDFADVTDESLTMSNYATSSEALFGGQSMVGPLRRVLVRRPDGAFVVGDPELWHYAGRPDLAQAQQEHDALVAILLRAGAEVIYHDEPQEGRADAIFVFDPALITDAGAVILRMGKALRRGEEAAMARRLDV